MNLAALSEFEQRVVKTQAYRRYVSKRNRLVLGLSLFHICLILLFDFLAIYSPRGMAAPAWPGTMYSAGLLAALTIIVSVIVSVFYYSYRVNREFQALKKQLAWPPEHD